MFSPSIMWVLGLNSDHQARSTFTCWAISPAQASVIIAKELEAPWQSVLTFKKKKVRLAVELLQEGEHMCTLNTGIIKRKTEN